MKFVRRSLCAVIIGAALSACSTPLHPPVLVPAASPGTIVGTLFLIGDAGAPRPDDAVLQTLTRAASVAPAASTIVFLGDNIYPRGLPDSGAAERAEAEARLDGQIAVARTSGAKAWFIPGNHDWEKGGPGGWAAIQRQVAFVREHGAGLAAVVPGGGCPGPVIQDAPGDFRLVMIDSQWWLQGHARPTGAGSGCLTADSAAFVSAMAAALADQDERDVVVLSHHPYRSHGIHGGHFTIVDHVFPLREIKPWLWVPLPIVGSAYPIARQNGVSSQDMSSGKYRTLLAVLTEVMKTHPPTVYAAGHDHSLQVLGDSLVPAVIVSGAGYFNHRDPVGRSENTRFAVSRSGFVRLDRLSDGRLRLGVIVVDEKGAREEYSEWVRTTVEQ